MILLTDHTDTSGGFECVPKFHHEWNSWSENNSVSDVEGATPYQGLVYVPKHDPLQSRVKNINGKAGILHEINMTNLSLFIRVSPHLELKVAPPEFP
jgi:hypothetical protein